LDDRQEKIGFKIREAQLQKVPYMLVAGDRNPLRGPLPYGVGLAETSARGRSTRSWRTRSKRSVGRACNPRRTLSHSIARPDVMTAFAPMNASGT
jgi:threonyl-tRNA synthetase